MDYEYFQEQLSMGLGWGEWNINVSRLGMGLSMRELHELDKVFSSVD